MKVFRYQKKKAKWLKVKIKEDGYKGFIKKIKNFHFLKPTHKINVLKAGVYKLANKKSKKIDEISLGSN